jgi:ASPIC and UnbV/FG-GAP-like repeat
MPRKGVIAGLVLGPAAAAGAALLGLNALDRRGRRFHAAGRSVVELLDRLGAAVGARDLDRVRQCHAADFSGLPLGLGGLAAAEPARTEEKDGVRVVSLAAASSAGAVAAGGGASVEDRDVALAAWRSYLDSFAEIEEAGFHLDRLERWQRGELAARVRFELIGRPRGARQAGIDRALFQVRFGRRLPAGEAGGAGQAELEVLAASLVQGERVIAERPQFADVSRAAGIDFLNRTYPPFLELPLRFGMIRYGPGGIAAVDYDNDGFHDLFIPDGVSSRLLRNRRDGTFEDVTEQAGLGGLDGVSVAVFADYDNDGWKDLFVSRTFRPNQLFHNNGDGTFTDVTARAGLGEDCCTTVAAWGDYDHDGRLDLYVGRYMDPRRHIPTTFYARNGEPNRLYHNNGDGTFTDVTAQAGVGDVGLCLGCAWGDYDGDGHPDLFVVNDFGRSTLYRNRGGGRFEDVTVEAGALAYGAGMSASFADYDNDGRLDLYTADIRSEHAWFASAATIGRYLANCCLQGTWRSDLPLYWEIFRQSGFRFVGVFRQMAAGNHLLHNRGDGTFEDVSERAGANPMGWFWGSVFADLDNDGWLDLYSANGWVYGRRGTDLELEFLDNVVGRQRDYKTGKFFDPRHFGDRSWHGWERNRHLRNNGDGTFREIGRAAGTDLVENSRGVAVADFWNRGALDIAVAANGGRHALLRNEVAACRHWLQVELTGTISNRDAVGARVELVAGGLRQLREVSAGDGYASQSTLRLHFGLGEAVSAEELVVRWPASGRVERFEDVAGDRIVALVEGTGRLLEKRYPAPVGREDGRRQEEVGELMPVPSGPARR